MNRGRWPQSPASTHVDETLDADRPMISSGNLEQLLAIARATTDIFASHDLKCCLTGGVASALYGTTRCPNDVDIVVLTSAHDPEGLKQMLTRRDHNFFSVPAKNVLATYKVLWYRLSPGKQCKVDVLIPGIMNIPNIPLHRIETIRSIPVMPFIPQLLLKLQAWADHRVAYRQYLNAKQYVDVADIDQLLRIARNRDERIGQSGSAWVSQDFVQAAQARVRQYVVIYPQTASSWRAVGFQIKPVEVPVVGMGRQRLSTTRFV